MDVKIQREIEKEEKAKNPYYPFEIQDIPEYVKEKYPFIKKVGTMFLNGLPTRQSCFYCDVCGNIKKFLTEADCSFGWMNPKNLDLVENIWINACKREEEKTGKKCSHEYLNNRFKEIIELDKKRKDYEQVKKETEQAQKELTKYQVLCELSDEELLKELEKRMKNK